MSRLTSESICASQAELPPIGTGTEGATKRRLLSSRLIMDLRSLSFLKSNSFIVE
jgi:hypothetical protein